MKETDVSRIRRTCFNCGAYRYFIESDGYRCIEGRVIDSADWMRKDTKCDRWREKK